MRHTVRKLAPWFCVAGFFIFRAAGFGAADESATQQQLQELRKQNQLLQEQLHGQRETMKLLQKKVSDLETATQKRGHEYHALSEQLKESSETPGAPKPFGFGKVAVTGEGGFAFFKSESAGQHPNGEFRVDELRLFLDAQVIENVYFFGELNLTTRELGASFELGEAYVDFEDVSRLWGKDRLLNIRVGRMDIPFGEEYLSRDAIDNPLISHSLADFWGYDAGIEFYGAWNNFDYVFAVLNGGVSATSDFTSDKSLVGRVGFAPTKWLRVSASAMRTGDLDAANDYLSAMWFGNGYFRSISATATRFHADIVEGDLQARWKGGHLKASGGVAFYDDNDRTMSNARDLYYYFVEAKQDVWDKFYVAARWSQIFTDKGYPLVGDGDFGKYFFGPLTEDLWRLGIGLGYRWKENLLFKAEYTINGGSELGGKKRTHENTFAGEVAFRF